MSDETVMPPSVRAAIEFLDYTRMVEEPAVPDAGLAGRVLTPEEAQTRKAALALLMSYFKRADPMTEMVPAKAVQDVEDDGPGARERSAVQ